MEDDLINFNCNENTPTENNSESGESKLYNNPFDYVLHKAMRHPLDMSNTELIADESDEDKENLLSPLNLDNTNSSLQCFNESFLNDTLNCLLEDKENLLSPINLDNTNSSLQCFNESFLNDTLNCLLIDSNIDMQKCQLINSFDEETDNTEIDFKSRHVLEESVKYRKIEEMNVILSETDHADNIDNIVPPWLEDESIFKNDDSQINIPSPMVQMKNIKLTENLLPSHFKTKSEKVKRLNKGPMKALIPYKNTEEIIRKTQLKYSEIKYPTKNTGNTSVEHLNMSSSLEKTNTPIRFLKTPLATSTPVDIKPENKNTKIPKRGCVRSFIPKPPSRLSLRKSTSLEDFSKKISRSMPQSPQ